MAQARRRTATRREVEAMWLFFETNNEELLEQMQTLGITATQLDITGPRAARGISFPAEQQDLVFPLLGINTDEMTVTTTKTNVQGVALIQIKPKSNVELMNNSEQVHDWDKLEPVFAEVAAATKTRVRVWVPHGKVQEPETESGCLNIYLWGTPVPAQNAKHPSIFGIHLPAGVQDGSMRCKKGVVLEERGMEYAEVLPRNIYVLFDLPHTVWNGREDVLRRILAEAIPHAMPGADGKVREDLTRITKAEAERERQQFLAGIAKARDAYVHECARRLSGRTDQLRKDVTKKQAEVSKLSQQILEEAKVLEQRRLELNAIERMDKSVKLKFEAEFEKLCRNPDIERVEVGDGFVAVFTKELVFKADHEYGTAHGKDPIPIGAWRIDIPTNGANAIKFHPLTPGMRHPHATILSGDNPCFGNIAEGVARFCAAYEYSAVAQLMIEYLRSS